LNNSGLTWADFNNDGLLDVHIVGRMGCVREGSPPISCSKSGNGNFKEIAAQASVAGEGDSYGANWIDFNNDGYLDLHVIDGNKQPDHLYKNNQNETFTDVINQSGIDEHDGSAYWQTLIMMAGSIYLSLKKTRQSCIKIMALGNSLTSRPKHGSISPQYFLQCNWIDFDNDGYIDLCFLTSVELYYSKPNLYRNTEMKLSRYHPWSRAGYYNHAYQSIWADYDNDGDPDLYLPARAPIFCIATMVEITIGLKSDWFRITNRAAIGTSITVVSGSLRQQSQVGIAAHARYFSQLSFWNWAAYHSR